MSHDFVSRHSVRHDAVRHDIGRHEFGRPASTRAASARAGVTAGTALRGAALRAALLPLACALAVALPVASHAAGAKGAGAKADATPEIVRAAVPAQAVGVAHTLRTIPEACARIEGVFTGQAAQPYKFAVVRTSPSCQPRARFVDAAKAAPSVKAGWVFNDLIRVPSAACPSQHAVVKVWRKPASVAPPALDAQGRARLYLKDSMDGGAAGKATGAVAMYAAALAVEGRGCR